MLQNMYGYSGMMWLLEEKKRGAAVISNRVAGNESLISAVLRNES